MNRFASNYLIQSASKRILAQYSNNERVIAFSQLRRGPFGKLDEVVEKRSLKLIFSGMG
jgi:hypothetical protein